MADTKQSLQFRKVASMPQSGLTIGAIYFDKSTGTINVATAANAYDKFGYGVKDATWANQKLTLTKSTGEVVELDFTNVASASDLTTLQGRVSTIETWENTAKSEISTLQSEMDAVEAKAAANEGKLAGVTETVVKTVDASVLVETNRAKGIEGGLDTRLGTLETKVNTNHEDRIADLEGLFTGSEGGSVQDLIDSAITKNNTDVVTPGLEAKADKATYEAYVSANDNRVKAVEDEIDAEVTRATNKEGELATAIATEKNRIDALIGEDVPAEGATQKTIRDIAAEEVAEIVAGADEDYNTLKEIADWIAAHPTDAAEYNSRITANATAIATLKGTGEGSVAKAVADAKAEVVGTLGEGDAATLAAINDELDTLAGADTANLNTAKTYAEEKAAAAQAAAEATAAGDATTKANAAQAAAEATAAADATAKANQALADAKTYYGEEIAKLDAEVTSDDALTTVKVVETDGKITDVVVTVATGAVDAGSAEALATAAAVKTYVDNTVSASWAWEEFE